VLCRSSSGHANVTNVQNHGQDLAEWRPGFRVSYVVLLGAIIPKLWIFLDPSWIPNPLTTLTPCKHFANRNSRLWKQREVWGECDLAVTCGTVTLERAIYAIVPQLRCKPTANCCRITHGLIYETKTLIVIQENFMKTRWKGQVET